MDSPQGPKRIDTHELEPFTHLAREGALGSKA